MAITVVSTTKYRKTCHKCDNELGYTYEDVKEYKTNHDYLGGYDLVKGIKCPVCSTILAHKKS
jgi:hypothetical protein